MMRQPFKQLVEDVLALKRIQLRKVISLLKGNGYLKKYLKQYVDYATKSWK